MDWRYKSREGVLLSDLQPSVTCSAIEIRFVSRKIHRIQMFSISAPVGDIYIMLAVVWLGYYVCSHYRVVYIYSTFSRMGKRLYQIYCLYFVELIVFTQMS